MDSQQPSTFKKRRRPLEVLSFRAVEPTIFLPTFRHREVSLYFTSEQRIAALMSRSLTKINPARQGSCRSARYRNRAHDHPIKEGMAGTVSNSLGSRPLRQAPRVPKQDSIPAPPYRVADMMSYGPCNMAPGARHSVNSCLYINIPHLLPSDPLSTHISSREILNIIRNPLRLSSLQLLTALNTRTTKHQPQP